MMILLNLSWIFSLLTIASMNEEMTLEEKRIENAMFAMVGEKPPHDDVPVEPHYMNPGDLLLTSIQKAKEERERGSSEKITTTTPTLKTTSRIRENSMIEQPHKKPTVPKMKMWLHDGVEEVILFGFWRSEDKQGLVISFVIIFIMGMLYEGLKKLRVYLTSLKGRKRKESFHLPTVVTVTDGRALKEDFKDFNSPLVENAGNDASNNQNPSLFSFVRITRGLVYIVELALACSLILIVMTYNVWLDLAVVLGAGFGHWIFE